MHFASVLLLVTPSRVGNIGWPIELVIFKYVLLIIDV